MTYILRDEEREILQFLSGASEERDDHISQEEIQQALQIRSGERVRSAITVLQRQGYIRRNPRFPIGFEILRRVDGSVPVRRSMAGPRRGSGSQRSQTRAGLTSGPPDVEALPARQRQAYHYIQRCILDRQLPPTVDELKDELGLQSRKFAYDILVALDRKGFIRLGDSPKGSDRPSRRRKSRTIELVHLASSVREPTAPVPGEPSSVFVPVMGDVAAGLPVPNDTGELHWDEIALDWMELPREVLGRHDPANVFLMKVDGDSMIEDGVFPGDMVLVLHHAEGADGDLVVARFTNDVTGTREATVKRYRHQNGHPWLLPANSAYAPIDAERAEIVGRVIALLRFPL